MLASERTARDRREQAKCWKFEQVDQIAAEQHRNPSGLDPHRRESLDASRQLAQQLETSLPVLLRLVQIEWEMGELGEPQQVRRPSAYAG